MAPPRYTPPTGAASIGYQKVSGFDYDIPVALDESGRVNWNAAVCQPNGVGMRVAPKWGQRAPAGSTYDHRSLTKLEGKADLTKLTPHDNP
jgi:hypothetical protein